MFRAHSVPQGLRLPAVTTNDKPFSSHCDFSGKVTTTVPLVSLPSVVGVETVGVFSPLPSPLELDSRVCEFLVHNHQIKGVTSLNSCKPLVLSSVEALSWLLWVPPDLSNSV